MCLKYLRHEASYCLDFNYDPVLHKQIQLKLSNLITLKQDTKLFPTFKRNTGFLKSKLQCMVVNLFRKPRPQLAVYREATSNDLFRQSVFDHA